ncbi:potassium channel family protein [Calidifontibacter indicus]|uniref:Voltage-gated potassium channel n=1 Tax=Calidifontibacter indicus TaxID=419650 RepID=A0A3D9UXE1_9MICO|nr:potassium channel family protein [Calidifontibacter indicus]REF30644.1 voltage-gated potassium channel [Calidifontibacter indicus]
MSERTGHAERWERATEWPLMATAVAFLVAYAVPILWPDVGTTVRAVCEVVQWLAWALFVLDYVVRLLLAQHRGRWVLRHLLDLAVIALPLLRPLRLLRLVTLLNVLNRRASVGLRGRVAAYLTGGSVLLSFVAALAVLDAERLNADASITSFGDAWWWALTTMTTVGYGDTFPVTTTGRFIASALMVGGIALLGTVTATLASWLADRVREEEAASDDVLVELRALRREIAELRAGRADSS